MTERYNFKQILEQDSRTLNMWNNLNFQESGEMSIWHYNSPDRIIDNMKRGVINLGSLSSMDDNHEGDYPCTVKNIDFWDEYTGKKQVLDHINQVAILKQKLYIMCWTARENEFEGFWKSFTDLENGVAIKTTVEKLNLVREKMKQGGHARSLKMFQVKYANFKKINDYKNWKELNFYDHHGDGNDQDETISDGKIAFGNKYFPAHVKRHSFFHEREVRLTALEETQKSSRFEIKFDWGAFVDEIYLAPKMSAPEKTRIRKEFANLLTCPVVDSKIYEL